MPKPCQHSTLHLCRSHANIQHFIRIEAVSTLIFVMKPRQHSTLALEVAPSFTLKPWSNVNTSFALKQPRQHFICIEAVSTLIFVMKLCQHFIRRSCDNIHEATSKLHLHRSHANIHEAMSTLHIAIEAMSTLYSLKLCQRSFLS